MKKKLTENEKINLIKSYFEVKKKFNKNDKLCEIIYDDSINTIKFISFLEEYSKKKNTKSMKNFKKISELLDLL